MNHPSIWVVHLIKSFSFRTFSHPIFNPIWDIYIENNKKIVKPGLVKNYLKPIGLAY